MEEKMTEILLAKSAVNGELLAKSALGARTDGAERALMGIGGRRGGKGIP